jgi:hypothetical protein
MAANQLAALIQASNAIGFKPRWVADWPDLSPGFLKLVGPSGNGMLFGDWIPTTINPDANVAKAISSIKSATPLQSPSVTALLGWIGMDIFIEGLTRATANGATPTIASFTRALRNCTPFDAGGIGVRLSYCGHKLVPQADSMYEWDGSSLRLVSGPAPMPGVPAANLEGQ